jgi:hypothetical protein
MFSKSLKSGKLYEVKFEKRFRKRVPFNSPIYYPVVNGKSLSGTSIDSENPPMQATDINEYGIGIRTNILLNPGDFVNLSIKLEKDSPTFECVCIVKWAGIDDASYIVGCEFCHIRNEDRQYIRHYMQRFNETEEI